MGYYSEWTKEEVWEKQDWEGGVCGLLDWGGADAFEALGPEAYAAAKRMVEDVKLINRLLNEVEEGMDNG